MQKLFQKDFEKFKTKEEKLMKEIGRWKTILHLSDLTDFPTE